MAASVASPGLKSKNKGVAADSEYMLRSLSDDLDTAKHISTLYDPSTDEYSLVGHSHLVNLLQQPKYVKVFKKSKHSGKMFQRLFFAQEMKPAAEDASPIWVTKFSKDGKYLAVGRQDGSIIIWKVISSPLSRLECQAANNNRNRSASVSSASTTKADSSIQSSSTSGGNDIGPDRTALICPDFSYAVDNTVFAPVFEDKPVRRFDAHSSAVISLDWSKNNFLVSGSMDNTARLWHIDRDESLQEFKHDEFVTSVNFHPKDDRFFMSACMDSHVRLWSILDGEVSFTKELPGLITAATFTPDGETCVVGGLGWCSVLETRGLDKRYDFHIKGTSNNDFHGPKITGIEAFDEVENGIFSTKLIITTNDSRIRKFNLSTRAVETKFKGAVNDHSQIVARVSDNNAFLISGSENHWCYIWSLDSEGHLSGKEKAKETFKKIFGANSRSTVTADARHPSVSSGTYKNSSYLVFHAHHTDVTCAIFAPTATSKLIELSNDPLYELYASYQACVKQKSSDDSLLAPRLGKQDSSTSLSSTLALHKNTAEDEIHPELSLIITADKNGNIRVFRRDFVYNIRKALRHDFHNKYKHQKHDASDLASLRPQTSKTTAYTSFISTRPPSIDTDSFVPLGMGSLDSQEPDNYSLSSDSSVEGSGQKNHVATERPIKEPVLEGLDNGHDIGNLSIGDDARGRRRINSIDKSQSTPQIHKTSSR